MSSIGPTLPVTKVEKRKPEEHEKDWPGEAASHAGSLNSPSTKKPRTLGPTLPPTTLSAASNGESSEDEDDFGPRLPSAPSHGDLLDSRDVNSREHIFAASSPGSQLHAQRDEWMIVPPKQDDCSSRFDPTKLKNRKFNNGKGAKGPSWNIERDGPSKWTETPDQKKTRLQKEALELKSTPAVKATKKSGDTRQFLDAKQAHEHRKTRGPSLYERHQSSKVRDEEDDPSARVFDREKDIAGASNINHTQRKEMMRKAADYGSKFSSGKFL